MIYIIILPAKLAEKHGLLLVHFVVWKIRVPTVLPFWQYWASWLWTSWAIKNIFQPLFEANMQILHWREGSNRFRKYFFLKSFLRYFYMFEWSVLPSLLFSSPQFLQFRKRDSVTIEFGWINTAVTHNNAVWALLDILYFCFRIYMDLVSKLQSYRDQSCHFPSWKFY